MNSGLTKWTLIYAVFFIIHHAWELYLNRLNIKWLHRQKEGKLEWLTSKDETTFRKSAGYRIEWNNFGFLNQLVEICVHWALILSGYRILDTIASRITPDPVYQGLLFFLGLGLVYFLTDLPFSVYGDFVIESKYGFNRKTATVFFLDLLKSAGLTVILGGPLVFCILYLMKAAGSVWWIWVFGLIGAYQLLVLWLYPRLIAPIFNKFTPLTGETAENIRQFVEKAGFHVSGIFTMDGSRRSSHLNAYFTGIGKYKRIVFYDTLLDRITPDQLCAVIGHEAGHYRLGHIRKNLMASIGAFFLFLALLAFLKDQAVLYPSLGFDRESDHAALVIFSMLAGEVLFPFTYLFTYISRKHEFASDAFAARLIGTPEPLREALIILHSDNMDTVPSHPWYAAYYFSHPELAERLDRLDSIKI